MNQRVMIAMAIACNPRLLIADEPTTALDVTIQAQILDLLLPLQRDRGMALVLITHNMGVVAETAHRVMVMYAGQIMEEQPAANLFASPQHPYTAALLAALPERVATAGGSRPFPASCRACTTGRSGCLFSPRCTYATRAFARRRSRNCARGRTAMCAAIIRSAIRRARSASRPIASRPTHADEGCGMTAWSKRATSSAPMRSAAGCSGRARAARGRRRVLRRSRQGKTLAVVGESGCGKSTLARMVTMIEPPTAGTLTIDGIDAVNPPREARDVLRRTVQIVFQNPYGSLNPRKTRRRRSSKSR